MAKQIVRNFYTKAGWLNYIINRSEGCLFKCETCQIQFEMIQTEYVHLVIDPDALIGPCGMLEKFYCDTCIEFIQVDLVANPIERDKIKI